MADGLDAGRVAVITGGASGIGLATARKCLGLGMKVMIADFNDASLKAAVHELRKVAGEKGQEVVKSMKVDVSSAEENIALANQVFSDPGFGEVGFLFLNAGMAIGDKVLSTPVATLRRQLDVNLYGVWHGLQAFVPAMLKQNTPCHIAATASFAGILNTSTLGVGAGAPYTISKHACLLTMEAVAEEIRSTPGSLIQTHALCPAAVNTNYMSTAFSEAGLESPGGAVAAMMKAALTPDQMAGVLLAEMRRGTFYIKGYDDNQPHEMLHAMLQARTDDIIQARPPLSHLLRTDQGNGVRGKIREATKVGKAKLKEAGGSGAAAELQAKL